MPDVQLDYEMMDQAAKLFNSGAQQLGETRQAMNQLAQAMRDGVLLGEGGDAFAEALQEILGPRLDKLQEKFDELKGDILFAVAEFKKQDESGAGDMG
jgi:WXG100 family type VII secretion target